MKVDELNFTCDYIKEQRNLTNDKESKEMKLILDKIEQKLYNDLMSQ
jgi:hypothetical protein